VYPSLQLLVNAVNRHAMPEGYTVVQKRSKRAQKGKGIVMKANILCDCHGCVQFKAKDVVKPPAGSRTVRLESLRSWMEIMRMQIQVKDDGY